MHAKNKYPVPYLHCPLAWLFLTTFALPPFTISCTRIFFNSGDILSRGILIGFPFPLPLPFDAAAAVLLDLGLALALALALAVSPNPPTIAFARSSLQDHLGIWYDSMSSSTCKNIKVISLEGQEEETQTALLRRPWWQHTCKSSRCYVAMHCWNRVEVETKWHGMLSFVDY